MALTFVNKGSKKEESRKRVCEPVKPVRLVNYSYFRVAFTLYESYPSSWAVSPYHHCYQNS